MPQRSSIEPLESRIAPASLIDARTVAFTDIDGDEVKIVFSKDLFTGSDAAKLAKANEVFKFDTGDVAHDTTAHQQLRLIDFTKFPTIFNVGSVANGVAMTITSTAKDGGDGLADVGAIKATGVSLGKITIDGDLGQVDAGGSSIKIGIASLTVDSIGRRGTATQIPVPTPTADNPAPDLISTITGELTALKVLGNVTDARIHVVDGKSGTTVTTAAKIGSITIGGSLIGRAAAEAASDETGVIDCDRTIGTVKIGTTNDHGIVGGGGKNSGRVSAGAGITSVTISGFIRGGAGANSGMLSAAGSIGTMSILGDLEGGAGESSGLIRTYGNMSSLTIGDDIIGGTGAGSGYVSALGAISKLTVKGDIDALSAGTSGDGSAGIFANGLPLSVIGGSVIGGAGDGSGVIESGRAIGATIAAIAAVPAKTTGITITGSVIGGAGDGSGAVIADGALKLATIGGSLAGGAGKQSGVLRSGADALQTGTMSVVTIKGAITGGGGDSSGAIIAGGVLGTVTLGNLAAPAADVLAGGLGKFSGTISAEGRINVIKATGDVLGGAGELSGSILSYERSTNEGDLAGNIGTVSISGGVIGGAGANSGRIQADGALTSLVAGSWTGGTGAGSGSLVTGAGYLGIGDAASIRILGDIAQAAVNPGAGSADFSIGGRLKSFAVGDDTGGATIRATEDIAALAFTGDVANTTVLARGQEVHSATSDVAIAKLTVGGSVSGSSFLAGYDASGAAVNAGAQIGAVSVLGNWTASNLVAGAVAGADGDFGTADDVKAGDATIVSKIASIVIGGSVAGAPGESFGFVAQLVAKMRAGTKTFALNSVADSQTFEVGAPGSGVAIREVPLA